MDGARWALLYVYYISYLTCLSHWHSTARFKARSAQLDTDDIITLCPAFDPSLSLHFDVQRTTSYKPLLYYLTDLKAIYNPSLSPLNAHPLYDGDGKGL